jgi:hypothetical protein
MQRFSQNFETISHFCGTDFFFNYECGIRPKHSNISKRVGEGVFTICVVLDQSTVIFQKDLARILRPLVTFEEQIFFKIMNKQEYND